MTIVVFITLLYWLLCFEEVDLTSLWLLWGVSDDGTCIPGRILEDCHYFGDCNRLSHEQYAIFSHSAFA